jgi:hypothetical protein
VDISYLNIVGTFFYLCSVLNGCSRFLLHWELRSAMTELDVEIVLQRARERYPGTSPRIITDNGPQFIAKDFKEFIRLAGLTHVKTTPYYPQSNGKSSDRTRASKSIVSGQAARSPSRMPLDLSSASLTITTLCGRIEETQQVFYQIENVIRSVIPKDQIDLVLENIGLPMNLNLALSDTATIGSADGEIDVSLNQAKHGPTFGYLKNIREQLIAEYPNYTYFQHAC